jgi:formylglycine-generating enzyme required for sulfatase activity
LSAYYGLQHARIASNSHFSLLSRFKLLPNMQASAALQSLIAEGQLEQAIELYISLSRQYADTARIDKGVHESARFHALTRQHLEGTISRADYQLGWNQINRATLALASQVPAAWRHPYEPLATTQGLPESTPQNPPQKSFLERWGLILGLVASLTTILGITLKDVIFPKKETTTRTAQPQSTASPTAQPTVPEKTNPTPVSKLEPKPPSPDFVLIKGSTYTMGDRFGEGESDEKPHTVTVSNFYLSKYEVTFREYDAFCAATGREKPSDSSWGRGERPAINVSWYDAIEYCNWLSQQQGRKPYYTIDKSNKDPNNSNTYDDQKWTITRNTAANGYRLPTEAEWEYAAREGGKKVRFGNGSDIIKPSEVNFDARESYKKNYSVAGEYRQKTVPVQELKSNALGLYHMSGNVWEWCWDWYGDNYTQDEGARNPLGATSGSYRVLRGGGWFDYPQYCRAANRHDRWPANRNYGVGFRLAAAPQ